MYNGERENKPIPPEIQRAQKLRSQVAQIEKSDKSNGTNPYIFMRKYSILMRFAETEKERKLNDIRKKGDELFKRKWTLESSEQLNEEVNTLGTLEMTLVRLERILKTTLIIGERNKIIKRDWTPESSEQMVFLNKEQTLLENPEINPDIAGINARLEEAKRVKTIAQGLNREYSKNGSVTTLIHTERLSCASDLLRTQAEFMRAQIPQKPSPVTRK